MKMRLTPVFALGMVVLLTLSTAAFAAEFAHYPEFRYTSALPGGGWGVTPDGTPGFEGALQTNVPVAYTPHRGIILGYASASFNSTPQFGFSGGDVNGTATLGVGFGRSGHGIYFSEMGTSADWESVQNLQVQVLPASGKRPAVAIGVQDILSQRDDLIGTKGGGARSFYAVATQEYALADRPLFVSLGVGDARFHGVFGGLSWRAHDKLTVLAEYDGWNINAGAALDLSEWLVKDLMVTATMIDLDRTVIGMTYVYSFWPDL